MRKVDLNLDFLESNIKINNIISCEYSVPWTAASFGGSTAFDWPHHKHPHQPGLLCSHHGTGTFVAIDVGLLLLWMRSYNANQSYSITKIPFKVGDDWDYRIMQRSVIFFWKGSDSKYFRLCGPYFLCCNYLTAAKAQRQPYTICKWMCLCSNKILFMYTEIWISYNFLVTWNIVLLIALTI